jgi:hypothetical protein
MVMVSKLSWTQRCKNLSRRTPPSGDYPSSVYEEEKAGKELTTCHKKEYRRSTA